MTPYETGWDETSKAHMHDIPERSYIYVVGPDIGPKKIGYAKDFSRRLSSYKTQRNC